MKDGEISTTLRDLHVLLNVGTVGDSSDGQLLARFVAQREEGVFEALVERHGPMVWGVCRRILRDHHDAEDAFQATFLVLARRAASVIPREKVGNWLYGVAYQTALKARAKRARRRAREGQAPEQPEPSVVREDPRDERLPQLDRELSRLPDKYRIPIVLCELGGRTHSEAANQLGWPVGTLSGRLSRAKAMLAKRLTRPGVALPIGSLAVWLAPDAASASPSARLIGPTARAASRFAAGRALSAEGVSAEVVVLTRKVLNTMLLGKLKVVAAVFLTALALSAGGGLAYRARAAGGPDQAKGGERAEGPLQRPSEAPIQVAKTPVALALAPDPPIDPKASYPFKIDPDSVYELPALSIEYRDFRLKAGPVSVVAIAAEPGITGVMIIGKGTFRLTPESDKSIEGNFLAAMLRFNPGEQAAIVPLEKVQKVSDRGVAEMSRQLLREVVRHCWQRNLDGGRRQEVLIPPKGAFAADLYSKEHGDLLISGDEKSTLVYNFTSRQTLYEKK